MTRRTATLLCAAFLALYWWMATSVSDTICTTGDEIAHLTAGYSYWKTGDYRLQPENGNLPQRFAAIPLLHKGLKFPTLEQDAWRISDVWDMGFQWFYSCGNDLAGMLRAGRRMIALFGVATGALVFLWARRLHGDKGALLAAGLFAFCPTMLANGALVTSDMAAACMFLAAVTAFWAMAHRLSAARLVLFGLALGLLCVSKFSAPLVAPMCAILFAVRLAGAGTLEAGWPIATAIRGRARIALSLVAATLAACAVAVAVIWASYGFRYAMYRQFEPNRVRSLVGWDVLEDQRGAACPRPALRAGPRAPARVLHLRVRPHLPVLALQEGVPERRLQEHRLGAVLPLHDGREDTPRALRPDRPRGCPRLLAEKGAPGSGGTGCTRGPRSSRSSGSTGPSRSRAASTSATATSCPSIRSSSSWPPAPEAGSTRPLRWTGACVCALCAWFAAESLWIRPHYIAYFNEIVGPRDAWRHVVDSSLDWGQDLPTVRRWLDANPPDGPVFISYFGSGDIVYYGIKATRVGDANFDIRPRKAPAILSGGLWIMSVTQFQQVYTEARGPWDATKEEKYRELLLHVIDLEKTGQKLTFQEGNTFEEYQFARLCHYLRGREPIAEPAYTFLIFKLTDAEVMHALYEPIPIR